MFSQRETYIKCSKCVKVLPKISASFSNNHTFSQFQIWILTISGKILKRFFERSDNFLTYQTLGTLRSWMDVFVCLVYLRFHIPLENFHSYGDVTIIDEGLQILTCTWHSWPLSSKGSLVCLIYCDMGHPFIMVISEDPWHSCLLPSVWQWSCHYLFLQLRSVVAGIRTPNLPHARQTLWSTAPLQQWTSLKGTEYKFGQI